MSEEGSKHQYTRLCTSHTSVGLHKQRNLVWQNSSKLAARMNSTMFAGSTLHTCSEVPGLAPLHITQPHVQDDCAKACNTCQHGDLVLAFACAASCSMHMSSMSGFW